MLEEQPRFRLLLGGKAYQEEEMEGDRFAKILIAAFSVATVILLFVMAFRTEN